MTEIDERDCEYLVLNGGTFFGGGMHAQARPAYRDTAIVPAATCRPLTCRKLINAWAHRARAQNTQSNGKEFCSCPALPTVGSVDGAIKALDVLLVMISERQSHILVFRLSAFRYLPCCRPIFAAYLYHQTLANTALIPSHSHCWNAQLNNLTQKACIERLAFHELGYVLGEN
jgi:hypothetical protein